jgi:hypothetical protein
MGRFENSNKVKNFEGGTNFDRKDDLKDFTQIIINSLLRGDSYYTNDNQNIENIFTAVKNTHKSHPEFIAKANVYARNVLNLRSVSHILAVAMAETMNGSEFIRRSVRKSIIRPDDAQQILSLWDIRHKTMLPNSLRRAFRDVFTERFDEYQLSKYKCNRSKVKLKDVVKLSHPKGKHDLFKKLIEDNLKVADTMVTRLASGEDSAKAFKDLLQSKKMGYMQALKNIAKVLNTADKETINLWEEFITNEKAVLKSRVLPFRFYDAWKAVRNLSMDSFLQNRIKKILEKAFTISASNTELMDSSERMVVILDESGSMGNYFEYATVLSASLLTKYNNVVVYAFDTDVRKIDSSDVSNSPFRWIDSLIPKGGGTYFNKPFEQLISTKTVADKIIIFTDMQMYSARGYDGTHLGTYLDKYRRISKNVKLLFWNLASYNNGTSIKLSDKVLEVGGYSDSMLSVISKIWEDKDALIKEIMAVEL